jgi:hypothetical protein
MIISRVIYNGDNLTKLGITDSNFPIHDYYTLAYRLPRKVYEVIKNLNVGRVTYHDDLTLISGNIIELRSLVAVLNELGLVQVASMIRNVLPTTQLVKV